MANGHFAQISIKGVKGRADKEFRKGNEARIKKPLHRERLNNSILRYWRDLLIII